MFRIKRHFAQAAAVALFTYLVAAAIPPTITAAAPRYFNYQGRLKKDGSVVNDFRYFRFRLTNETGASEYYTSGSTRIYVTNGLFNYKVGPLDGVNFAANPLYMEVSVGENAPDNLLLPREALVSSPYAIYAASAAYSLTSATAAYAQNSGVLSTRSFDAFVSTRAENQTVGGVKTFLSTAVFQQNIVVGQNVITQSSVTVGDIESSAGVFVNRGDPSAWDKSSWTYDVAWYDWDLSGIVPAGAKTIVLRLAMNADPNRSMFFRKKGNINEVNVSVITAGWQDGGNTIYTNSNIVVSISAGRVIQYRSSDAASAYRVFNAAVIGWFK